ncbi:type II secretion system minor pseudopilin GspK [Legionella sp. CNM-4043-24]|uniref:type II secretion system minor pseudopilin GspK n=1 Tax=Legionella sp. CNM-4043-24 TaxID=3421646 RepID=UPI00403AD510
MSVTSGNKRSWLERGSALLTSLFIMTLVAIAATAMSTRLQLDIYRTRLSITADSLYLASQYVTFWAMSELSYTQKPLTRLNAQGAIRSFPLKLQNNYPDLLTSGKLIDAQDRFNLNNLSDRRYYRIFLNLLQNVLPQTNTKDRELIAFATRQWLTPYDPGRGNDSLVSYYLKQKPPYYQSGFPMQSVSEFRLIWGVDATIWQQMEPYITVLPEVTPININTAPKIVLMSLGNGLTEDQANQIINARSAQALMKSADISKLLGKLAVRQDTITLESQYFWSQATISNNDLSLINYSLLKRVKDKKGNIGVSLVSENLNSL